jgi:hypothetical protein
MAIYIVAPEGVGSTDGKDGNNGSSTTNAMSLDKASGNVGGFTPQPGDIFELRGGIYAQVWNQVASGSSSNPIVYRPYSTETAIIDGSRNASNLTKATPDPWTDVTGETGWSSDSYTSATGSEPNVYSKTSSSVQAVWVDQYEAGMGASKTAGVFCSLWNMSQSNADPYGNNPNLEIHSYDSGHDLDGTVHEHEWYSQFMNKNGKLWIRLWETGDLNPVNHQIYASNIDNIFIGNTISNVTVDGVNNRIKFWRCRGGIHYGNNSTNIIFKNVERAFGGYGHGVYTGSGSVGPQLENCRIIGGGSNLAHTGDGVWFTKGSGSNPSIIKNNYIAFTGHTGLTLRDDSGGTKANIEGNVIHHTGGVGLFVRGLDNSSTINYNTISYAAIVVDTANRTSWNHAVKHEGMRVHSVLNTEIRRNLIFKCGYGLSAVVGSTKQFRNNSFIHNTVFDVEAITFEFRTDVSGGSPASNVSNIVFANNIFHNMASNPGDDVDFGVFFRTSSGQMNGYMAATKFVNNQVLDKGKGAGGVSFYIVDGNPGTTFNYTLAQCESTWPSTFSTANIETDPNFVNETGYADLTLDTGSPCLNTGNPSYTDADSSGTPDMGYVEGVGGGGGGPANQAPVISSFTANTLNGVAPLTVDFTCSASDDSTTSANLQYDWLYGDKNSGSNTDSGTGVTFASRSHVYENPGVYTCKVTVTDDDGSPLNTIGTLQVTVTSARPGTQYTTTDAAGFTFTQGGTGGGQPNVNKGPSKTMDWNYFSNGGSDGDAGHLFARDGLVANPQWWKVDFGSSKTITRFRTSFYRYQDGREYNYDLEYSTDDAAWSTIKLGWKSETGSSNEFTEIDMSSPITARYIRLTANSNSESNNFLTIWETQIWEDPTTGGVGNPIPVIATQDRVGKTHLDTSDRFNPSFVINGNGPEISPPHQRWIGSRKLTDGDEWIYWDFGADKTVKEVQIAFYRGAQGVTFTYDLQKSLNATPDSFVNIAAAQTNAQEVWTTHNFGTAETARRIRVRFTAASNYACASCWELKAFEEAP